MHARIIRRSPWPSCTLRPRCNPLQPTTLCSRAARHAEKSATTRSAANSDLSAASRRDLHTPSVHRPLAPPFRSSPPRSFRPSERRGDGERMAAAAAAAAGEGCKGSRVFFAGRSNSTGRHPHQSVGRVAIHASPPVSIIAHGGDAFGGGDGGGWGRLAGWLAGR